MPVLRKAPTVVVQFVPPAKTLAMAAVVIMNSFEGPPTTNPLLSGVYRKNQKGDSSSEPSATAREACLPEPKRLAHRAKLAGKIFISDF